MSRLVKDQIMSSDAQRRDHRSQESTGHESDLVSFSTNLGRFSVRDILVTDQSRMIVSRMEELVFKSLKRNEAGQYECSAENGIGSSLKKRITVSVTGTSFDTFKFSALFDTLRFFS